MFVFSWWKDIYANSLEMAARNTLSSFSPTLPHCDDDALNGHGEAVACPSAIENEMLTALGELSFCVLNLKGEGVAFGEAWQAQTQLPPERCMGAHFSDFFHPQHRQLLLRKIQELVAAPDTTMRFRAQYGSTHVGYRWYEFTLALRLTHEQDQPVVATMLRDISREMETERVLRTAQIETELALRARAEFLGHMSHELRTPLNAILGFAEMMELGVHGEVADEHYRDYLTSIRESGHMLLGRINDMLEVASIEVGDTDIHDAQITPAEVLEAAMQLHRHDAFCRRVTLKIDGVLPSVLLRCDLAKVTRALSNILANSIRFSKAGGVVMLSADITKQGSICFSIRDGGEGISADHLEQLQEALERKSSMFASCPERVCLGLGLIVAKEFTCLHGGRLFIDSEKGRGTEVTLTLPQERVISLESPRARRRKQLSQDTV